MQAYMMINFQKTSLPLPNMNNGGGYRDTKLVHICEIFDYREILTPEERFLSDKDYSPRMYLFKVLSPRTCGNCGAESTLWWDASINHKSLEELTEKQ